MNVKINLALAVGLLAASAGAQVLPMERRFARDAYAGNLAEVSLGRLAVRKAVTPQIQEFGRRMARDHGRVQIELAGIMKAKKILVPPGMKPEAQALYKRLQKLKGVAFDRAYRQAMVADHQMDVAAYSRIATRGSDPDLRGYATRTLPTLKTHLRMIRATRVLTA